MKKFDESSEICKLYSAFFMDVPLVGEAAPHMVTGALIKSGQRARKLAEMTGTPLVVVESGTCRSPGGFAQKTGE